MMLVNPEESDFSLESPIWTRKGIEDLLSTFRLNPNFGVAANILDKLPLEYVSLIPRDIIPELQDLITELFRSFIPVLGQKNNLGRTNGQNPYLKVIMDGQMDMSTLSTF
uniref:Ovule protein n=1 Tax=Rhabditophanes sp. KR3021 TaxID=114890 RepID=A0AC35U3J7_9BILA